MNQKSITFSVVIPVCNGQDFLATTMESIRKQSRLPDEVIVVDDGSTDSSVQIVERYRELFPKLVVESSTAQNWVESTRMGIRLTTGDVISILHQDDFWHPSRIERILDVFKAEPDVSLVVNDARFVSAKERDCGRYTLPFHSSRGVIESNLVLSHLIIQNWISVAGVSFSRLHFDRFGKLDSELWFTADWKLWLSLAWGGKLYYLPEILSNFRLHNFSQTVARSEPEILRNQYERVVREYLPVIERLELSNIGLQSLAFASIELNVSLAGLLRGDLRYLRNFFLSFTRVPFNKLLFFLKTTRILQRSVSRIRARLSAQPNHLP